MKVDVEVGGGPLQSQARLDQRDRAAVGLLGTVALTVDLGAIGCPVALPTGGLHANRGRSVRYRTPPAQIRTGPIRAYGSYLGYLTAKRCCGQG